MSSLTVALEAFHFIRPLWLLLIPVALVLWWWTRRRTMSRDVPAEGLAPHLRKALTIGASYKRRFQPIDTAILAALLGILGAAGPTWSRVPDPFVAQTAPLVVAIKVTDSMTDPDVPPERLERGKQKIRDLLDLRTGARTALVAYAGTAHRVVPMTEDPKVMQPYLEGLSPDIMPIEGADAGAALALAVEMLSAESTPGGILFVLDSLQVADRTMLDSAQGQSVAFLEMLPEGKSDPGLHGLAATTVVRVTPDASDIRQVERALNAAYRQALLEDGDQPWEDRGWFLAWPAALIVLFWFRRGWTMRWAMAVVLGLVVLPTGPARADGVVDWFLTPDQQGWRAYQDKDFGEAAELFVDPMWQAYALYRDGQYSDAAQAFNRLETADAAFAQGMAHIKGREYRDGVRAFEKTLERDPDYPGAEENLELAREIVDYVEQARVDSDTGEELGIGADDVVFDNEAGLGVETQIEAEEEGGKLLTAEQWMNTVDTSTGEFLHQRFLLEAQQQ